MKNLRFSGLLVTVLLLAFGLALGCSTGGSDDESTSEPLRRTTYEDGDVRIVFSNRTSPTAATARAALQTNDNYWIYQAETEISKGKVEIVPVNVVKFYPEGGGAEFIGDLTAGVLTIANIPVAGGQFLSVRASEPGSGNTGSGGNPGTPGTGTGPGGTVVSESRLIQRPIEADYISYTATPTTFAANTPTADITFVFSKALDTFNLNNITFTNGTGKVDTTGASFSGAGDTFVVAFPGTPKHETGNVTVTLNKSGVDPNPRKIPIYGSIPAFATLNQATFALAGTAVPTGTNYFVSEATALTITMGAANPNIKLDNIGWQPVITNDGTLDGLKAQIELSNLRITTPNTVYTADVKVLKQGPVEFFLQGIDPVTEQLLDPGLPASTPASWHATKVETMDYNIVRVDGQSGVSTTENLKLEYAYNPDLAGGTAPVLADFTIAGVDNAVWGGGTIATAIAAGAHSGDRAWPADTASNGLLKIREGMMRVVLNKTGFSSEPKYVQVFRKPLHTYTVDSRVTAGITTHLVFTFPDTTIVSDFTDLANGDLEVVSGNRILTLDNKLTTGTIAPDTLFETSDLGGTETTSGFLYVFPLVRPIERINAGNASVRFITGKAATHPDIDEKPVAVSLQFGSYVSYDVTNVSVTAANAYTFDISVGATTLLDPWGNAIDATPEAGKIVLESLRAVNPAINAGTFAASAVTALTPAGVFTITPGTPTGLIVANADTADGNTATFEIKVGRDGASVPYLNYFFDPDFVWRGAIGPLYTAP